MIIELPWPPSILHPYVKAGDIGQTIKHLVAQGYLSGTAKKVGESE